MEDPAQAMPRRIAHQLREKIISGELAMGSKLNEREIAEELRVSRIPVREALPILAAEGFISSEPRRAAVVHTFTLTDAEELFDLRLQLEPLAAGFAARRARDGADVGPLRESLALAHAETPVLPSTRNSDLHEEIIGLAGHSLLTRMTNLISGRVRWQFRLTPERDTAGMWQEHKDIVDAIVAGAVDLATMLSAAHVERARVESLPLLRERLPGEPPKRRRRRPAGRADLVPPDPGRATG